MRVPVGLVVVFAVSVPALGVGCSRDARPVVQPDQPAERPPLPPASGTPIGYLVDGAAEIELRDDQLTRLKAIDDDLAGRLAVLDGQLRSETAPPPAVVDPDPDQAKGRGLGFWAGGRQGELNGASGSTGAWTGIGAGSAGGRDGNEGPRTVMRDPNAATRIGEERAATVRAALAKAFALLDAAQREIARRVLANHGVDPDAEGQNAQPAASPERALEPEPRPRRR